MSLRHAAFVFLALVAVPARPARAQSASLTGTVIDSVTAVPVAGASVRLAGSADSARVPTVIGADNGSFTLRDLVPGRYQLEITRLGYAILRQSVLVVEGAHSLGRVRLRPTVLPLRGVEVKASPPPAIQHADTTEFAASAVKTHPDATAEELVGKMPGLTVDNTGTVKSNGEQVQQVLVDGKPYFSNDPTIALRNLPADVIDRIQVYDKLSDQAEFSGFDDGQSIKTMNLVLRADRRHATFGKGFAGGGQDDRYQAGGNLNLLRGPTRAALIGLANNVNQQNFSPQDLLGVLGGGGGGGFHGGGGFFGGGGPGGGRRFGGDRPNRGDAGFGPPGGGANPATFLVGPQDGLTTTDAVGMHAQGTLGKRLDVNGSYFFNNTDNQNQQDLARQYVLPFDSIAAYRQSSSSHVHNRNHRLDGRIEWQADSSNSVVDQPRLYWQANHTTTALDAENDFLGGALQSQAENDSRTDTDGHNLSNHLLLRHRFATRGRTVSLDLGGGHVTKVGSGTQSAEVAAGADSSAGDTLDQRSDVRTVTSSLSARLAWTEPLGRLGALQATVAPSATWSGSDNLGRDLDPVTGAYTTPDSTLTNTFHTRSVAQSGGLGWRIGSGNLRWLANLAWQQSRLHAEREFPPGHSIDRTFDALLPSLTLNDNLPGHRNLRIAWNTSTRDPSINQLQDVVDNSNPLVLSSGNPALGQAEVQTGVLRFSSTDPAKSHSQFLLFSVQHTRHSIANATFTAFSDTVIHGVALQPGVQLTSPVNLDGAWNANSFVTVSRPAKRLHSIVNLNTGVSWSRVPGLTNGLATRTDTWALSQGVVLASNISEALDFTVGYTGTINLARDPVTTLASSNSYTHNLSLRLNLVTWRGVVMRQELSHALLNGVSGGFGQDVVLWNSSLGEKLLNNRLDLRLTATDILGQNRSTSRTVTESYIQDARNQTLPRYVMLTATYTWSGAPQANANGAPDRPFGGRWRGGGDR